MAMRGLAPMRPARHWAGQLEASRAALHTLWRTVAHTRPRPWRDRWWVSDSRTARRSSPRALWVYGALAWQQEMGGGALERRSDGGALGEDLLIVRPPLAVGGALGWVLHDEYGVRDTITIFLTCTTTEMI
jgi:hypothetical protein